MFPISEDKTNGDDGDSETTEIYGILSFSYKVKYSNHNHMKFTSFTPYLSKTSHTTLFFW